MRNLLHGGEAPLMSYLKLNENAPVLEGLLNQILRGVLRQKYKETEVAVADPFDLLAVSVSRGEVETIDWKSKELCKQSLSDFDPFAILLDTIHRGGGAFVAALGIDLAGRQWLFGFYEGSTENREVCQTLFESLEKRGLTLSKRIRFVSDGGRGVIEALTDYFGKKPIL